MGEYPSDNGFDYKCPKCGCHVIHTWLVAICYDCDYEGTRLEFANNNQTREHEEKFAKRIPQLKIEFKERLGMEMKH